MTDAMVTARMSQSKKDAGNKVLKELGYSASQAINELYDAVLATGAWPLERVSKPSLDPAALGRALSFVDGIARIGADDADGFESMSFDEAKQRRLIEKGRATETDFL